MHRAVAVLASAPVTDTITSISELATQRNGLAAPASFIVPAANVPMFENRLMACCSLSGAASDVPCSGEPAKTTRTGLSVERSSDFPKASSHQRTISPPRLCAMTSICPDEPAMNRPSSSALMTGLTASVACSKKTILSYFFSPLSAALRKALPWDVAVNSASILSALEKVPCTNTSVRPAKRSCDIGRRREQI